MADPNQTQRDKVMAALVDLFEGIDQGQPTSDPYPIEFSTVTREDIGALGKLKSYALGIYDTEETKDVDMHSFVRGTIRVIFEFHTVLNQGEKPSEKLNLVLGVIQRKLAEDQNLGGLTIDIIETGNEFQIDGPTAKEAIGLVFVNVLYRHKRDDPRTQF